MWKNRLCYLALLACTGLFFICYDGYLSLYVFSLSLLLPFVSLAVSLPGMLGARAVLSAGGAGASGVPCARKGENIPLRLRVWNVTPFSSGRIRVRLSVENTLTGQREQERFSISASPLPQVLEHQLSSRACGQLLCRMERAWVSDYLGLFSLPLLHNPRQEAAAFFWPAVHPLVLELQESSVPDSEGERYSQTKPGDDPTELFALRDWREGDRLSRIHWKLSQKLGRPLVKELGLPLSDHRLFLLDLNGTGTEADALLDAFASLSSFLAEGEVAHRAAYWEPSAQVLHCREVVGPEDLLPLWKEAPCLGRACLSAHTAAGGPALGGFPCDLPLLPATRDGFRGGKAEMAQRAAQHPLHRPGGGERARPRREGSPPGTARAGRPGAERDGTVTPRKGGAPWH